MKENKLTKWMVIKIIIVAIVAGCITVAAWFSWIYDLPSRLKYYFLKKINQIR